MSRQLLSPQELAHKSNIAGVLPAGYDRRNPNHPLRRPQDYGPDGSRRRNWSGPERKFRLTYRRHPVLTLLCTAFIFMSTSVLAFGAPRVGSIYAASPFADSGWATCAPITWTTDTKNLPAKDASLVRQELASAFAAWAEVSGLSFIDGGNSPVVYDDTTSAVRTETELSHNIAVYFVPDAQSTMINKSIVGFGSPSKVYADSKEIVGGYVVVSSDFMKSSKRKSRLAIFTHEVGHALGLGHSEDPNNIMFAFPQESQGLGSGDIEGIRALTKRCSVV